MNEAEPTLADYQAEFRAICDQIPPDSWIRFFKRQQEFGRPYPTSLYLFDGFESPHLTDLDSILDAESGRRFVTGGNRLQALMSRNGRAYWLLTHPEGTLPPEFIAELSLEDYKAHGDWIRSKMALYRRNLNLSNTPRNIPESESKHP